MYDVIPVPPGATMKEQMSDKGMRRGEFADRMGMTRDEADDLLMGVKPVTVVVAERLEKVLGPPAGFWLNLERIYRDKKELLKERKLKVS